MQKSTGQNGFTLVEVLVAITLLVVGILAAASMQISALGGNTIAIRVTEASTLAERTIEDMMGWDYDDPLLLDGGGANDAEAGLGDTNPADGGPVVQGDYTLFWNVAEDYPFADCKTIRVIVRRSDRGVGKTVALDFIKMRPI